MAPVADTKVVRDGKKVTVYNVAANDYTMNGEKRPGPVSFGENVELVSGKYVRLFGVKDRVVDGVLKEVEYDKKFAVGDSAEYDSYNLSYIGKIVSIGEKTILVEASATGRSKKKRLSLYDFSWRNWDFDADAIAARNLETSLTI